MSEILKSATSSKTKRHLHPGVIAGFCALLLFAALAATINTKPYMPPKVAQKYMEYWLIDSARQVAGEVRLKHVRDIEPFYLRRDYQPIWMDSYELTDAGASLVQVLQETSADHWREYGYSLQAVLREIRDLSNLPKQATAVDVLLTDAFITYAQQALNKELLPDMGESDHPSYRKVSALKNKGHTVSSSDIVELLKESLNDDKLSELITQLTPNHSGYQALRKQLNQYQKIMAKGQWYALPPGFQLQENQRHRLVPHIRWLLTQYGDLKPGAFSWLFEEKPLLTEAPRANESVDLNQPSFKFDQSLVAGIKHFQSRFQLEKTGEIDAATLEALNIPPYHMAQKIALNMKRWRHLPRNLGERHIMVNMADFRLQFKEGDKTSLDMKVITGRPLRRTPVLSQTISTVVLAPTWSVPRRIAIGDILPQIKRDPKYLERKGFSLVKSVKGIDQYTSAKDINWKKMSPRYFPYRLVQKAGQGNALGDVKFVLPNDKSIYLHDTNHPELFARDMRALSSGCIRVEQPKLLADKLISGQQGWNRSNIDSAINQNRTTHIRLQKPVPVYLMYWTTWVDDNGNLQIRDDVYQRDLIGSLARNHQKSLSL
jgi:murein L,D-transpeptidase YcbB/YkuD|tara:strand:+ start:4203 stop:6005 length:1803 start_codon:yes stop_codon:yes gene_type:complete